MVSDAHNGRGIELGRVDSSRLFLVEAKGDAMIVVWADVEVWGVW